MPSSFQWIRRARAVGFLVLMGLLGCTQDPTCVFTTGCNDSSTGGGVTGGQPATLPAEGAWISNLPPVIEDVFPQGGAVGAETPIAIRFNESMNAASLVGAFELVPFDGLNFLAPVSIASEVLVGDGRLLLLFPATTLTANGYRVRVSTAGIGGGAAAPAPADITGQELGLTPGVLLGSVFSVPFNQPVAPALITTFPPEGETAAGAGGSFVAVFDRALDPASVTANSFQVLVNGAAPIPDPAPVALNVGGMNDTRVFTWRSTDASGTTVDLPASASVDVLLSPTGSSLTDLDGDALPDTTVSYGVASFSAPAAISFLSQPEDAIGIRNLTLDGNEDLAVQVDLLDAVDGDTLELFLFGVQAGVPNPDLVALRREFPLTGASPILVWNLDASDVDLTLGGDPSQPRFEDGPVSFGARIRHLNTVSPLRLLDGDPGLAGVQDPILDTVPPSVLALDGSAGSVSAPTSDVRDLVLIGQASEELRSVEVSATSGTTTLDNGTLRPMPAAAVDGTFIAPPVPLGVLTGGSATFSAVAYDQAFNPSAPFTGTFTQRGGVGPGAFTPGDTLFVEVVDGETLFPITGAIVAVHADLGDGVNYPLTASTTTASDGSASVATDAAASEVILTVERAGYDVFTFHGVTASRASVALTRTGTRDGATVMGTVQSSDPTAFFLLPALDGRVDDTRRSALPARTFATGPCMIGAEVSCPYGPEAVRIGRRGARSYFAGGFLATEASFSATNLLQAFCFELALPGLALGSVEDATVTLPFLLIDPTIDPSEVPEELVPFGLRVDGLVGLDTANLDGDPATTGDPRITVETSVPGLPGTLAVGQGLAFVQGGGLFTVRSARPGAVTAAGFFGGPGSVDSDSFVRCELRDTAGNVSGVRTRASLLAGLPGGEVFAPDVPAPTSPGAGSSTAGRAFVIRFPDTLPDGPGGSGVFRVELTDVAGRVWTLWRRDPAGSGTVDLRVVDLRSLGGAGLADGSISCRIESHAWTGMDPAAFLFTDVEREEESYARTASLQFTQSP